MKRAVSTFVNERFDAETCDDREGAALGRIHITRRVILIPVGALCTVALALRPRLFDRYGVALAAVTLAALAGTILTVSAGKALRARLGSGPGAQGNLIARHAHVAGQLQVLMIVFALILVAAVAVSLRRQRGARSGVLDRPWLA